MAYVGEIRAFSFTFVPQGWKECNGQTLSMQQHQPLYAIIGQTFGGGGSGTNTTFNLPDLRGYAVIGEGNGPSLTPRAWGKKYGEAQASVSVNQTPAHNHTVVAEQLTGNTGAQANTLATPVANSSWLSRFFRIDSADHPTSIPSFTKPVEGVSPDTTLHPATIGGSGGGSAPSHENRQPYLTTIYCICYDGEFPVRPD
ncbi:Collar domain-containing protein [Gammaproteobacteria bacterium]